MSSRDKKALLYLAIAVVIALPVYFWPQPSAEEPSVGLYQSIPLAEQRLRKLRSLAATVPVHDTSEKKVQAALAEREKHLIVADTAAQAQAQLLKVVRGVCERQTPPVEIRGSSFGQPRQVAGFYGEINVTVNLTLRVEQLVNLMAELATVPELAALDQTAIGQASDKQKLIPVQIAITALVPKSLVPEEKKGLARF